MKKQVLRCFQLHCKKGQTGSNFTKNILLSYNIAITCFQEFNLSKLKYDLSISRIFEAYFWQEFATWYNCAPSSVPEFLQSASVLDSSLSLSGFSMCRLFIILVDVQISSLLVDMRNGRVGIMIQKVVTCAFLKLCVRSVLRLLK